MLRLVKLENRSLFAFATVALEKSFAFAVATCRCAVCIAFGDGVPVAFAKVAHFEAFPVAVNTRLCGFDEIRVCVLPHLKGDWLRVHGFTILKLIAHTHGLDSQE